MYTGLLDWQRYQALGYGGYRGLGIGQGWQRPWIRYKGKTTYLTQQPLRSWPEIYLQSPAGQATIQALGIKGGPDPYTAAMLQTFQNINQAAEERKARLQRGEDILAGAGRMAQEEYQRSVAEAEREAEIAALPYSHVPDIVSQQFNRVNEALAASSERAMKAARMQAQRLGYSPTSPMTRQMQEDIRTSVLGQQQQALSTAALNQALMEQRAREMGAQARERAVARGIEERQRALLAAQRGAGMEATYLMEEPSVIIDPASQLAAAQQMWQNIVQGRPEIYIGKSRSAADVGALTERLQRNLLKRALGALQGLSDSDIMAGLFGW